MAIAVMFTPDMNREQYDEVIKRLDAGGLRNAKGRLYHVCYENGEKLNVFDVWDSVESFQEFGKTLMPILQDVGVNAGEPTIREAYDILQPQS
jgi:hypothetical protein